MKNVTKIGVLLPEGRVAGCQPLALRETFQRSSNAGLAFSCIATFLFQTDARVWHDHCTRLTRCCANDGISQGWRTFASVLHNLIVANNNTPGLVICRRAFNPGQEPGVKTVVSSDMRDTRRWSKMSPLSLSGIFLCCAVAAALDVAFPFNSQVPTVARVGQPYNFQFAAATFTSPEPANISYTLVGAPAWLNLNGATRTLYGIPGSADSGPNGFTIAAQDSTGVADVRCTLVVAGTAAPTVAGNISNILAAAGELSGPSTLILHPGDSFDIVFPADTFEDDAGKIVAYYATSSDHTPLPSWIQFNSKTLTLTGRAPALSGPPQSFSFALIASEVAGFTGAAATFTLFISVNQFAFAPQEEVLNVTIGIPIDYTALQSQLLLNGVQAARDQIRSVAAQLPSWLSVDNETFALSGTPPSGFQSQDANITVTDVAGDVAIKTLQLRAANFSLFNGEVGSMTATAGQPFSYTFNQSMFTRQDLTLSCQLGAASSWLTFDSAKRLLHGTPPADANPTRVDANVTARSSTLATSESQKFSIQIKAAKAGIHSSTTSYSSASASVPPASRPTPSPPTGATSRSSHDRSRAGVIAGAVVGGLVLLALLIALAIFLYRKKRQQRSRSPRKLEISRPILQEGEQIEALQGFSDLEKAESAPDRLPAEPPQIALDLPSPTRQPSASKYRISLASSIGDGEAAIRADSNIPVWGRRSAAQHTPHDSYSAATEIARLSRLSPTKRLSQNLLGKRNPRQSLGLGIDTGMQDQPSQRSRRTEVLSDGRSRSSFGSLLTRNTSVLSAKPSDFPQPPRSSWRLSRAMIPGLSITDAADKRKSIRLVDRTDSVPDTRPLAEKRQSFIRNRASSGVQSPLFATGSRASSHALHGPSGSVGGSSVEASSVRHHPSLRRETRGISRAATTHSASSSLEPPARNPRRLDRSHVGSRDFEVIQETNSPTHSANSRDQNSNFTTTSSDTDSASLSASDVEADIQAQLALPRHQRTWVLPGEASPTPPPLTPRSHSRPSTAGSSNPSRNESVAREALRRKWAQRLHRDSHGNLAHDVLASSSSPPANAAVIMPARGAIGDYLSRSGSSRDVGKENQSSLTASKGKRSSGIREPMSLVSNDSLRGARTERPRLVLRNSKMRTGSETVGPKEEVQRLSSLKAMDADAGAGNDEWEDVVEEDASETEKERKEAKEMTPMSTLSGKAFV